MKQVITFCKNLNSELADRINFLHPDRLFLLTDRNTHQLCLPLLEKAEALSGCEEIVLEAGDTAKNLTSLSQVWQQLSEKGATRHSLLINLGGGMITDLGGFAAATFKRGIRFIHVPTTLLAMVDASVGGKTGINFNGLKNEIGAFAPAEAVLFDTRFLQTLDRKNILSGYAEMLKHGLLSSPAHWAELLNFDTADINYAALQQLVSQSVHIKEQVVEQDPYEQNIRKGLNFGHTVGHAFESMMLADGNPVLHGYAVAWGIVCELYLSAVQCGFPTDKFRQTVTFIRNNYGTLPFDCKQYDRLYAYMQHDKKNEGDTINFTLLGGIGEVHINQTTDRSTLYEAFDFFRENMN